MRVSRKKSARVNVIAVRVREEGDAKNVQRLSEP
jgi:hypothetical protein